jgi:hypothetical protein
MRSKSTTLEGRTYPNQGYTLKNLLGSKAILPVRFFCGVAHQTRRGVAHETRAAKIGYATVTVKDKLDRAFAETG